MSEKFGDKASNFGIGIVFTLFALVFLAFYPAFIMWIAFGAGIGVFSLILLFTIGVFASSSFKIPICRILMVIIYLYFLGPLFQYLGYISDPVYAHPLLPDNFEKVPFNEAVGFNWGWCLPGSDSISSDVSAMASGAMSWLVLFIIIFTFVSFIIYFCIRNTDKWKNRYK